MISYPRPVMIAAFAAAIAFPFSIAAAGTLLLTAGLGSIIYADYVLRRQRIRLPKVQVHVVRRNNTTRRPFRAEAHQLAA